MRYLIISDEQLRLADKLGLKGYQILVEVLTAIRHGKTVSERGLAKHYDISHKVIRTFVGHIKGAYKEHIGNTDVSKISNLQIRIGTLVEQCGHILVNSEYSSIDSSLDPVDNLWITLQKTLLPQNLLKQLEATTQTQSQINYGEYNPQARSARSEVNEVNETESVHYTNENFIVKHHDKENEVNTPLSAKPAVKKTLSRRARAFKLVERTEETQDHFEVFEHWKARMNHPKTPFTDKYKQYIDEAFKAYSKEQCIAAIDGCAKNPWNMGSNPDKKVYDNLELILRPAKIDDYIKYNETTPNATSKQNFGSTTNGSNGPVRGSGMANLLECIEERRRERAALANAVGGSGNTGQIGGGTIL